jgi:ectoine hydroxylase-related dioxygenase (phytanoyl-CoA dioxygenase family)
VPSLRGTREGLGAPPDLDGHEIVPVPGRAGDLVVWDIRLQHGNLANRDRAPRVVQYVSMFPHGDWGETPADHQRLWREGRDFQDPEGPPGHEPADLTALGRRLVGLDPYG